MVSPRSGSDPSTEATTRTPSSIVCSTSLPSASCCTVPSSSNTAVCVSTSSWAVGASFLPSMVISILTGISTKPSEILNEITILPLSKPVKKLEFDKFNCSILPESEAVLTISSNKTTNSVSDKGT